MALSVKNMLGGSGGGASPFAWGKYEYLTIHGNVKFGYVSFASDVYKMSVSSTDIDVSILESKDFVGIVVPYTNSSRNFTWTFKENNVVTLEDLTNPYTADYTYEYNSPNILIQGNVGSGGTYSATSQPIAHSMIGDFIEYVTDKNPLKYPNGEVHTDGYFYRYANEGLYTWSKSEMSSTYFETIKSLSDLTDGCDSRPSCVYYNGKVHIFHNYAHYTYDYETGTTTTLNTTSSVGASSQHAFVYNENLYIYKDTNNWYMWNESDDTWTKLSTNIPSCQYGAFVEYNNEIHGFGNYQTTTNNHIKWDGSEWSVVSNCPYTFYWGSAVVYNGKVHLLGGASNTGSHYSWDGETWTNESTIPYTFYDSSALVYGDKIHIFGSASYYTYGSYHYSWDGTAWTNEGNLNYTKYRGGCVIGKDKYGYSFGLLIGGTASAKTVTRTFGSEHSFIFKDYAVSDAENAYPNLEFYTDGYYYKRLSVLTSAYRRVQVGGSSYGDTALSSVQSALPSDVTYITNSRSYITQYNIPLPRTVKDSDNAFVYINYIDGYFFRNPTPETKYIKTRGFVKNGSEIIEGTSITKQSFTQASTSSGITSYVGDIYWDIDGDVLIYKPQYAGTSSSMYTCVYLDIYVVSN